MKAVIDFEKETGNLPHYWEMCVGSCHAATALREDYRRQLERTHKELGFQYVRFHGLFDDDMSVVLYDSPSPYVPSERVKYNFMNTDNIFDFLLSIGMKPFIELGFMPSLLASGSEVAMAYGGNKTPPKDYNQWADFIEQFTRHLEERYGEDEIKEWFFEVWNEPNLEAFWTGSQADYFKLYEYTARAIKKVNTLYQVGGPATSINAWIPEFKDFCKNNHVPLDFISTHHYPTDDPLWNNPEMDLMALMMEKGTDVMNRYDKHIMRKMTERAKEECEELPLYYTEWSLSALMGDVEHDTPYASAAIARIIHENIGMVEGYSYWTFSDIFEEMRQMVGEFQGGFGLQTYHGIRKPAYRIFELLHKMGNQTVEIQTEDERENVGIMAAKKDDVLTVLIYNHNTKALNEIETEQITLKIAGNLKEDRVRLCRIDEEHGNARRAWSAMGEPLYVNQKQLDCLDKASDLVWEYPEYTSNKREIILDLDIPPYGIIYLEMH